MSFYTTTELANLLNFPIDALGTKGFADTEAPVEGKEILYSGYDIITYAELEATWFIEAERLIDAADRSEASLV